jgi:hypothetical protein
MSSVDVIHTAGVDLVDVARFRTAVARSGEPFLRRVFGQRERAAVSPEPERRIAELAALFGVKESVVKAIGGMPVGGRYADIGTAVSGAGITGAGTTGPGPGAGRTVRLGGELARWAGRHRVELVAGTAPAGAELQLSWVVAVSQPEPEEVAA